jgi:hypothetical protein
VGCLAAQAFTGQDSALRHIAYGSLDDGRRGKASGRSAKAMVKSGCLSKKFSIPIIQRKRRLT